MNGEEEKNGGRKSSFLCPVCLRGNKSPGRLQCFRCEEIYNARQQLEGISIDGLKKTELEYVLGMIEKNLESFRKKEEELVEKTTFCWQLAYRAFEEAHKKLRASWLEKEEFVNCVKTVHEAILQTTGLKKELEELREMIKYLFYQKRWAESPAKNGQTGRAKELAVV